MFSFQQAQHNNTNTQKGFTIIEFVVIMGIFAIMAGVALFNFRGFSSITQLNNTALDIALEIKRAQTLGSSSIGNDADDKRAMSLIFRHNGSEFEPAFTVVWETPVGAGIPFGQLGDIGVGDLIDRQSTLVGTSIGEIRINDGSLSSVDSTVAVSFRRPLTEPLITATDCGTETIIDLGSDVQYDNVCAGTLEIDIKSADTTRIKTIFIEPTGNIYVR